MALDVEEEERVAELKAWWRQHGTVVLSVVVAAMLSLGGWQGWRIYQQNQSVNAGALFESLLRAANANDTKAVRDASGALIESYPRSMYSSMGALTSARFYFDRSDLKSAKVQLGWVIENTGSEEFRDLARLRLATLLLDEKAFDEALKLLDARPAAAFDAQYAALRGDILVEKKQVPEARAAYQLAIEKSANDSSAFRETVRMRLDALGGRR